MTSNCHTFVTQNAKKCDNSGFTQNILHPPPYKRTGDVFCLKPVKTHQEIAKKVLSPVQFRSGVKFDENLINYGTNP